MPGWVQVLVHSLLKPHQNYSERIFKDKSTRTKNNSRDDSSSNKWKRPLNRCKGVTDRVDCRELDH